MAALDGDRFPPGHMDRAIVCRILCAANAVFQTSKKRNAPFVSFGIQISFSFAVQMVFGVKADEYGGAELLRAMSLGVFSRLDALLVLIWLISGLFRICLLSYLIHGFYSALKKEVPPC